MLSAFIGAGKLPQKDRVALKLIMEQALDGLKRCNDSSFHWRSSADALNMAEALCDGGICSDDESRDLIKAGQCALSSMIERRNRTASWAMKADEIAAINNAFARHHIQLDYCSMSEYGKAWHRAANKIKAALSGNAPRGVQVLTAQ